MTVPAVRVTIIIAAPPEQETIPSFESLKQWGSGDTPLELIIARGRMPSIQRNHASMQARGTWLYFLDDDSVVDRSTLEKLNYWMETEAVDVVGGPNVCPASDGFLQSVFAVLLGSYLTFGPSRARYVATGSVRETNEKELILCHLLVRKASFERAGQFDEALYPNEENAMMEKIQHAGGKLCYDPEFLVWRSPRKTLPAFIHMLFRYGRGRAQQFRKYPSPGSVLNMAPALFGIYLVLVFAWVGFGGLASMEGAGRWILLPGCAYLVALIVQTLFNVFRLGAVRSGAAMWCMPICHLAYGVGFLSGLWRRAEKQMKASSGIDDVVLEKWIMAEGQWVRTGL